MKHIYQHSIDGLSAPLPVQFAENDTELYWLMALQMYTEICIDLKAKRRTVFIVPVGPVHQYRRFVRIVENLPVDLSNLHLFFMDEYLDDEGGAIDQNHPLSFRGFVNHALIQPMARRFGFQANQVYFPNPQDPAAYDKALAELGGASVCFAGVGINGHLAFNEAPSSADSPSRNVVLTPETRTTNSHTSLGGAYECVPSRAVTVGMQSILSSRRLSLWMNRPWQKAVIRKLLFGPVGPEFPASFARNHGNAEVTLTTKVAEMPEFALR